MASSVKCRIKKDFVPKYGTSAIYLLLQVEREQAKVMLNRSWPPALFDDANGLHRLEPELFNVEYKTLKIS